MNLKFRKQRLKIIMHRNFISFPVFQIQNYGILFFLNLEQLTIQRFEFPFKAVESSYPIFNTQSMPSFSSLTLLLAVVIVSQASGFAQYETIAIQLLKKGSDSSFFKRNANTIASLLPPIQDDLSRFLNKNSRTLSGISRNLLPKVQRCNGDYRQLGKQAQILCAPLLFTDGANCQRIIRDGKQALKSINSQKLVEDCIRIIPKLN